MTLARSRDEGFDTLESLSPRGWVSAKCDFWGPKGRTTGGEENREGSQTPDDPYGVGGFFVLVKN